MHHGISSPPRALPAAHLSVAPIRLIYLPHGEHPFPRPSCVCMFAYRGHPSSFIMLGYLRQAICRLMMEIIVSRSSLVQVSSSLISNERARCRKLVNRFLQYGWCVLELLRWQMMMQNLLITTTVGCGRNPRLFTSTLLLYDVDSIPAGLQG